MTEYSPGDLRMRRKINLATSETCAYIVEEATPPFKNVSVELLSAQDALLLMRELGSPYKGNRSFDQTYPDKIN